MGSIPSAPTRNMIPKHLRRKCRELRRKEISLEKIINVVHLPKTTVYDQIKDIPISLNTKKRFREETIARLNKFNKQKKGRPVPKPKTWSEELIYIVAHFMFDGEIAKGGCIYYNRSKFLINRMGQMVKKIFSLDPIIRITPDDVIRLQYYFVEFRNYINKKTQELLDYIPTASKKEKKVFLKAFFDDEGGVYYSGRARRIRGYQHSRKILYLVQNLLKVFDIISRIDNRYTEVDITGRKNLFRFRDQINFSPGIYINPDRKNSLWKNKIEKRKILEKAISSYLTR